MSDIREGTIQHRIYELIKEKKRMSVREIRSSISANYNTIKGSLIRLTNLGLIERVDRGIYAYKSK